MVFSIDDLTRAYELDGVDKTLFPSTDALRSDIQGLETEEGRIEIVNEGTVKIIPQELLGRVNNCYDGKDLLQQIGGMFHRSHRTRIIANEGALRFMGN